MGTAAGRMNNWPKIADMLITTGWHYGDRTAAIAAAVSIATNKDVTRNAVIGRADRIGMPRHPKAQPARAYEPRPPAAPTAAAMRVGGGR